MRRTGKKGEAKAEYLLALQRDAFPFRELPEFQSVLRDIAAKQRVPLLDIVAPLEADAKDGIIGLDVLVDYVHLSERSQEIVAQKWCALSGGTDCCRGSQSQMSSTLVSPILHNFWAAGE